MPVFVLTHHARAPLTMQGGTTFHFVTGGIHEALALARDAAGGRDVRVGGGVATVREYLKAGLLDELHLAVRPVLLGQGEALFEGLDLPALGYSCERQVAGERATHMFCGARRLEAVERERGSFLLCLLAIHEPWRTRRRAKATLLCRRPHHYRQVAYRRQSRGSAPRFG